MKKVKSDQKEATERLHDDYREIKKKKPLPVVITEEDDYDYQSYGGSAEN
jgi:hypothetical protein